MQLDSVFVSEGPRIDVNSSPVGFRSTRESKEESADILQCCRQRQDRVDDKQRSGRPNTSSAYDSVQMYL